MAATTVPASAADAHTVPEWVEKNSQLFKTCPKGFHYSAAQKKRELSAAERDAVIASIFNAQGRGRSSGLGPGLEAGIGGAELTDDDLPGIDLPTGPQPSDYWKNVENHGNILVTFITTARRKAGFIPSLSGTEFTPQEAEEYTRKFSAWMNELDSYVGYVHLVDWVQQTAKNDTTDCNVILKGVSDFVLAVAGVAGALAETLALRITSLVRSAANYVTQTGSSVTAGFTLETTETTGGRDPIQPISYTSTIMSKTTSGKSTAESSTITLACFTYKLNSAAIISMADQLAAGSTVFGSKQYRDYVNAPLNSSRTSI